ncbi:hypothetical protein MTR67_012776, partial [Solanum verrucosum]
SVTPRIRNGPKMQIFEKLQVQLTVTIHGP